MLYRCILWSMTLQLHEVNLQLQRRIGEQSHQISFCRDLKWHQVEHTNLQRSDFLTVGTTLIHHENILMLQQLNGWKFIW